MYIFTDPTRSEVEAAIDMSTVSLSKFLFSKMSRPDADFWPGNLRNWNNFKFVIRGLHRMATSGALTKFKPSWVYGIIRV